MDNISDLPNFVLDFAGLKSFKLRSADLNNHILLGVVLQGCKQLEELDLTGFIGRNRNLGRDPTFEDEFWSSFGKNLTKLRLHEGKDPLRDVLSFQSLGCIAKNCPKLRSLGIDLQCDGQEWVSLTHQSFQVPLIKLTATTATPDS